MNYIKHQTALFERFADDTRITPFHISLYFALFQLWNRNRFRNPFPILREEVMHLAHIGSTNTYAKCIKQLRLWGYIDYTSSGNVYTGWKVSCITFDTGTATRTATRTDPGTDTGTATGTATGSDTTSATGTATVYKEINNTNRTNSTKQDHHKIVKNGKQKKSTGRFHINNDKDYSEPL
ncbi:hypothetical protein [uncultured Draconibacterium sp.]|uniref:hypothetical protein n=1 Tax=uncultured Draconibacterium sp. TaxID=1573823 RepID=UPI0029C930B6|nr:hypothetical protein [uncultured Draconibacterium sp.]